MPQRLSKELSNTMTDQEVLDFIRETIQRLHAVADYLETYVVEDIKTPQVPFDTDFKVVGSENEP